MRKHKLALSLSQFEEEEAKYLLTKALKMCGVAVDESDVITAEHEVLVVKELRDEQIENLRVLFEIADNQSPISVSASAVVRFQMPIALEYWEKVGADVNEYKDKYYEVKAENAEFRELNGLDGEYLFDKRVGDVSWINTCGEVDDDVELVNVTIDGEEVDVHTIGELAEYIEDNWESM